MAKIRGIGVYIKWPIPSEVMTLCRVLTHSVPKCINNCRVRDFTRRFRVRHDPLWVCLTCQLAATCGWRSNDNLSFQTSAFMQMCQTLCPQHAVYWSAVHTQGASLPREVPPIPYRLDGQKCPLNSLFKLWNQRILRLLIEPNFEFWHLRPTQFFVIVLLLNWKFWATVL